MPMLWPDWNPLQLCNILRSPTAFSCVFYHVLVHLYRLLNIVRWAKAGIMHPPTHNYMRKPRLRKVVVFRTQTGAFDWAWGRTVSVCPSTPCCPVVLGIKERLGTKC